MTGPSTQIWTGEDLSEEEFIAITDLLRERRQFDLSNYKDRCIKRRIAKRLRACDVADVQSYLHRLMLDRDEMDTLLATISIHVSQFFRNPDTYQIIEQSVLPELCQRARVAGQKKLTLWSAGCATGEEPFSLALLVDAMNSTDIDIEILATDVSQPVLETAQKGLFDHSRLKEVPPEVIQEYFNETEAGFELIDRVRNTVLFKQHNILTDTDYPYADLILCRNVMIYFTRTEQERILSRFARVLPERGALVLGRSETITGKVRDYFKSEYPVERIYRRSSKPVDLMTTTKTVG